MGTIVGLEKVDWIEMVGTRVGDGRSSGPLQAINVTMNPTIPNKKRGRNILLNITLLKCAYYAKTTNYIQVVRCEMMDNSPLIVMGQYR